MAQHGQGWKSWTPPASKWSQLERRQKQRTSIDQSMRTFHKHDGESGIGDVYAVPHIWAINVVNVDAASTDLDSVRGLDTCRQAFDRTEPAKFVYATHLCRPINAKTLDTPFAVIVAPSPTINDFAQLAATHLNDQGIIP